jgi:aryl-alcohol dehydrogenase-like predicted oxidoreductase
MSKVGLNQIRRLAIGTAQFGLDYGISNAAGKIPADLAKLILRNASIAGITMVDTAAAYGDAEFVLAAMGHDLPRCHVTTKTISAAHGICAVLKRARQASHRFAEWESCTLLVHSAGDLQGREGAALWRSLLQMRERGYFTKIGISAYASDDPVGLARRFRPNIVQLPVSILDQRLVRDGVLAALKSLDVEIHARSVFLQGAIFLEPGRLPAVLRKAQKTLSEFREKLAHHHLTPLQAAMAFPLSVPEIDRLIVGVTSPQELTQILSVVDAPLAQLPWREFATEDDLLLDPRAWRPA